MSTNTDVKKLTDAIVKANENKLTNLDNFDIYEELNTVLKDVGLSMEDSGGKVTFYGQDPYCSEYITSCISCRNSLSGKINCCF